MPSRASNTAICPSKRIAAPETSGFSRRRGRVDACRVAKLSEQSRTISAAAREGASSSGRRVGALGALPIPPRQYARRRRRPWAGRRRRCRQDLALQIGQVDLVGVDESQRADAAAAKNCTPGLPRPPTMTISAAHLQVSSSLRRPTRSEALSGCSAAAGRRPSSFSVARSFASKNARASRASCVAKTSLLTAALPRRLPWSMR